MILARMQCHLLPGVVPVDPNPDAEPQVPTDSSGSEVLRGMSEGSVE